MQDPQLQKALREADEGRLEAAIAAVRFISTRAPERVDALLVLGMLLVRAGRQAQAVHFYQRATKLVPHHVVPRINLANALLQCDKAGEAVGHFRHAITLEPSDQSAWHGLMLALATVKDQDGYLETAEAGLRRWPDWGAFAAFYLHALTEASRVDEALAFSGRWLERHPGDLPVWSFRLAMLNYRTHDRAEALAAYREYGARVGGQPRPPCRSLEPERPLRLGILSGDLRTHSVGYFVETFLERLPADFTPVVFSTRPAPNDALAKRFRALVPNWREVGELDAVAFDREIRDQEIDLLLELSGHTHLNRLDRLLDKPAPVIIHALGYPSTTGHPAFDGRLVDGVTDPPGSEAFSTEGLLRLDPCFLCYRPPANAPAPGFPQPDAPIAFGSFNNTAKVSPETVELWARILARLPAARLLLKSPALRSARYRDWMLAQFAAVGVGAERVEILPYAETAQQHLPDYARLHVALDPLPYNGATTTCEALWMGVPVVTLLGDRHVSRVGASLLQAAGCPEWVARSADEYVRLACELAGDRAKLQTLRTSLRDRLRGSALLDAESYGQKFYAALREAWRAYVAKEKAQLDRAAGGSHGLDAPAAQGSAALLPSTSAPAG